MVFFLLKRLQQSRKQTFYYPTSLKNVSEDHKRCKPALFSFFCCCCCFFSALCCFFSGNFLFPGSLKAKHQLHLIVCSCFFPQRHLDPFFTIKAPGVYLLELHRLLSSSALQIKHTFIYLTHLFSINHRKYKFVSSALQFFRTFSAF